MLVLLVQYYRVLARQDKTEDCHLGLVVNANLSASVKVNRTFLAVAHAGLSRVLVGRLLGPHL